MSEKLRLDLSKHCIKTEIKKKYEENLSLCLKGRGCKKTEDRLEILKGIMEKNDFAFLRGKYKALAGKTDLAVFLHIEENKNYLEIDGKVKIDLI